MKQTLKFASDLAAIAKLPQLQELLRKQNAEKLAAEESGRCACLDEIAALDEEVKSASLLVDAGKDALRKAMDTMEKRRGELAMAERTYSEVAGRWQSATQRLLKDHGEGHVSWALMQMHFVIEEQRLLVASFEGLVVKRSILGYEFEDAKKKAEHLACFRRLADLHAINEQLRALVGKRCATSQLVIEVDALLERAGLARSEETADQDALG